MGLLQVLVSDLQPSTIVSNTLWHFKWHIMVQTTESHLESPSWKNVTEEGILQRSRHLLDKRPNQGLSIQDFLQGRGGTNIQKVLSRRELYSTQHVTVVLNSLPQADVEAKLINELKKELENNHWRTTYLDAKECMWLPTQEVLKLQRASNWKYMAGEVLLNKTVCCYGLRCLIYSLRVLVIEYLSGETWEVPLPTTLLPQNALC